MRTWLSVLLLAACGSTPSSTTIVTNTGGLAVEVEVSSISLADDCGGDEAASRSALVAGDCAPDSDCGGGWCDQTTMQLSIKAGSGGAATEVRVVKVELLDDAGAVVSTLAARSPQRWDEASGGYVPWDGAVAPGATFGTSFELTAPAWEELPGGRWGSGPFQARVTVSVGGSELTRTGAATVAPDAMVVT